MGTRADFYIGRGKDAKWIGSTGWDGYPHGITPKSGKWPDGQSLFESPSEEDFTARLALFFAGRDDVTLPERGWPWPWPNSQTTDYAYAFDGGEVWASCFGGAWFDPREKEPDDDDSEKVAEFPEFSKERMAPVGSKASGVTLIGW
jgi:hypothetical protein